jgi:hypothetical protein
VRILFVISLLFMASCSSVSAVKGAVDRYCALPAESRMANREAVAVAVEPHRIEITCGVEEGE